MKDTQSTRCKRSLVQAASHFKFLKPGALAQLRDSKIHARLQRKRSVSEISLIRSSMVSVSPLINGVPQVNSSDDLPFISTMLFRPVCLRRKKVPAVRSAHWWVWTPPDPLLDAPDHAVGPFNSEI